MAEETKLCDGCPTNPPCASCPNKPKVAMRVGLAPVIAPKVKKERPPLDRTKMGFGKHEWEYIDPEEQPTDFGPPDGVARRDFNAAFNRPNDETTVTIDHMSRLGALISTNAKGFEGEWLVTGMPQYKEGVLWAFLTKQEPGETDPDEIMPDEVKVPMVALGVIADRHSNLYEDTVVTKLVAGGKANRDTRTALTKKSDEAY